MMRITWTPEQCAKLREMYNTRDVSDIAVYFGCSETNIYGRARKLGLTKHNRKGRWSEEENAIMRQLWPDKKEIARRVGRTVNTVTEHARKNGLKMGYTPKRKWTPGEDVLLRDLYPVIGRRQTALKMGISEESVKSRAKKLGLRAENWKWSDSDIAILKEKFQTSDRDELENILNRSGFCIYTKAYKLGLMKGDEYVSKASVKNWMNLSYRKRGMRKDLGEHSPMLVELNRARIILTRKLKEYGRIG